ncbi:GtrA family protein, partial [Candidatus Microgenomates bacterium]|nr:GtrA family protein [Candidatus Microgenomates bacterium]
SKVYFLIKFLLSGGLSAATLYTLLFLFHLYLGLSVIISSTLAYALSMVVGFSAQKYWTFQDRQKKTTTQFSKYASLGIFNIGANAFFMHLMINVVDVHYAAAQFISLAVITLWSFVFYRKFVFQISTEEHMPPAGQ